MNQSEAAKQIIVRPGYHGTLGIISIITIVFYLFELRFIFIRRSKPPYNSLFYLLWRNQAFIDIFVLCYYLSTGFLRNFPFSWPFFLSTNGSSLPLIIEILGAWQLMAEIGGVVIISLHRLLAVCFPLSRLTTMIDECPHWILTALHLILAAPIAIPYLFEAPPYYYYETFNTVVMLYTNHHVLIQLFYFDSFCVVATVTSIICYVCIFGRLFLEDTPSFALFCALLNESFFVAASTLANVKRWSSLQTFLHAYVYLPNFILAITNPWCFLMTMSNGKNKRAGDTTTPFRLQKFSDTRTIDARSTA